MVLALFVAAVTAESSIFDRLKACKCLLCHFHSSATAAHFDSMLHRWLQLHPSTVGPGLLVMTHGIRESSLPGQKDDRYGNSWVIGEAGCCRLHHLCWHQKRSTRLRFISWTSSILAVDLVVVADNYLDRFRSILWTSQRVHQSQNFLFTMAMKKRPCCSDLVSCLLE